MRVCADAGRAGAILVATDRLAALLAPADEPLVSGLACELLRVEAHTAASVASLLAPILALGQFRFAMVLDQGESVSVLLRGAMSAHVDVDGLEHAFSGSDVSTWSEHAVSGSDSVVRLSSIEGAANIASAGREERPAAPLEPVFEAATVIPEAFVVRSAGLAQQQHGSVDKPARPVDEEPITDATVVVSGGSGSAQRETRTATPPRPAPLMPGMVRGLGCVNGHPNRASDATCRVCGSEVGADAQLVTGPRPPLGWLVIDDGRQIEIVRPCVIGHLPPEGRSIGGEMALAIVLDDTEHHISRCHLEIQIAGWDVRAVDLGSTNGSSVRGSGGRASPLTANEPRVLVSGDALLLGSRTIVFTEEID